MAVKSAGADRDATLLELSPPIDGSDGMRALPDGRIVLAESRGGGRNTAQIETIKDVFKLSLIAVTVVGDTVWAIETRFVYLNDPQFPGRPLWRSTRTSDPEFEQ